jgi:hypothetical protein
MNGVAAWSDSRRGPEFPYLERLMVMSILPRVAILRLVAP